MEFQIPPPMALEPGEEGVYLFKHMTQDTPDDELVGLTAPVAPKDWEKPASLLTELKLQELKDTRSSRTLCLLLAQMSCLMSMRTFSARTIR